MEIGRQPPVARRCLQPQAAIAWLREEPGREEAMVQKFSKRWPRSPTDAIVHVANHDSDALARGLFLCCSRLKVLPSFSVHTA